MPNDLSIRHPAWHTVTFDGVPIFRGLAWALKDARLSGVKFKLLSADRREGVAEKFGKQSQQDLYDGYRLGRPGFLPANPPGFSSHELRSDGNPIYPAGRGKPIPKYMLGIDAVDAGSANDAIKLVRWLNAHGYSARRPYPDGREAHHFIFTKSPARRARLRLAKHYARGNR